MHLSNLFFFFYFSCLFFVSWCPLCFFVHRSIKNYNKGKFFFKLSNPSFAYRTSYVHIHQCNCIITSRVWRMTLGRYKPKFTTPLTAALNLWCGFVRATEWHIKGRNGERYRDCELERGWCVQFTSEATRYSHNMTVSNNVRHGRKALSFF